MVGMPGLSSWWSTYCPTTSSKWRWSQHTSADQTPIPCFSFSSPGFKQKGRLCMWRADAAALSNRVSSVWLELFSHYTCSDAGTLDFGVHSPKRHHQLMMLPQPAPGECWRKTRYKQRHYVVYAYALSLTDRFFGPESFLLQENSLSCESWSCAREPLAYCSSKVFFPSRHFEEENIYSGYVIIHIFLYHPRPFQ